MQTLDIPYALLQTIVDDETFSDEYRTILSHCDTSEGAACILARQILQAFFTNAQQFGLDFPHYIIPEAEPYISSHESMGELNSDYRVEIKSSQAYVFVL